jgi:polysaccharide pyruvyl transferase WcaK-like protein
MVTITVIGWYGTETLGDRGILAGILGIFGKCYGRFRLNLGSLYPFFSERTIREDGSFWRGTLSTDESAVSVFDSTRPSELNQAIEKSDIVVIGGGPLMDLEEIFMLRYAFFKAKRAKKKTAILGCGIGPLRRKKYMAAVRDIVSYSDVIVLRDRRSLELLRNPGLIRNFEKVNAAIDPAVFPAHYFRQGTRNLPSDGSICVNLRDFQQYARFNRGTNSTEKINRFLMQLVHEIALENPGNEIKLVPNHYFGIGGDDRVFMNRIKHAICDKNVTVQNVPLSLEATLEAFSRASSCVGMRFHSIVFQSLVNGNNFILDYTESDYGKISGFLEIVDKSLFYDGRYLSLQNDDLVGLKSIGSWRKTERFPYPGSIPEFEAQYVTALKNLE